jgi:hypothetical protein
VVLAKTTADLLLVRELELFHPGIEIIGAASLARSPGRYTLYGRRNPVRHRWETSVKRGHLLASAIALWGFSAAGAAAQPNANWVRVQSLSPGQWSVTGGSGSVWASGRRFSAELKIDPERSRRPDTHMVEGPDLHLEGHIVGNKVYARLLHEGVQHEAAPIVGTIHRSLAKGTPEADKIVFSGKWEFLTLDF